MTPARIIGIKPIVSDHLHSLVGYGLRKNGEEIDWLEGLEVAVDLWVESRAIDDGVFGVLKGHFCFRKRIAQNVLVKALAFSAVVRRNTTSQIDIKTGLFPGPYSSNEIRADEAESGQFGKEFGTEKLF